MKVLVFERAVTGGQDAVPARRVLHLEALGSLTDIHLDTGYTVLSREPVAVLARRLQEMCETE